MSNSETSALCRSLKHGMPRFETGPCMNGAKRDEQGVAHEPHDQHVRLYGLRDVVREEGEGDACARFGGMDWMVVVGWGDKIDGCFATYATIPPHLRCAEQSYASSVDFPISTGTYTCLVYETHF